jgi:hypothetical protein
MTSSSDEELLIEPLPETLVSGNASNTGSGHGANEPPAFRLRMRRRGEGLRAMMERLGAKTSRNSKP